MGTEGQAPPPQPMTPAGAAGQPMSPQGVPLAEWWKRLVAAIIDNVIIGIPANILGSILLGSLFALEPAVVVDPNTGFTTVNSAGFFATFLAAWGGFLLVYFAITAAYYIFLHSSRGQTVGKMVMKIKVVDEATGELIPAGRAGVRWGVGALLSLLCGIGGLLDGLWPLWDPKRQALHDKPAKTLVVDIG